MTMELFLGGLIALTLAAVIIVLLTAQNRVDYAQNDRARHKKAGRKGQGSDQNA